MLCLYVIQTLLIKFTESLNILINLTNKMMHIPKQKISNYNTTDNINFKRSNQIYLKYLTNLNLYNR